jgi:hypothetical protein
MKVDQTDLNLSNYLNKYWFITFCLLFGLYIIYNYTIYVILAMICIYINIYYSDKTKIYKTKIIEYLNNQLTGYLGNCSFDPLPKTKT